MKIQHVFFDLDHTLWDFEKNSALTFQEILPAAKVSVAIDSFLNVYIPINFSYWKKYREEKVTKKELKYLRLKETFDALKISIEDEVRETNIICNTWSFNLGARTYLLLLIFLYQVLALHKIKQVLQLSLRNNLISGNQ